MSDGTNIVDQLLLWQLNVTKYQRTTLFISVRHYLGIGQIRRHIGDANLAGNN